MHKGRVLLVVAVVSLVLLSGSVALAQQWSYEDGTYRGIFADGSEIQVSIQLSLVDNVVTAIRFRGLAYNDTDYRDSETDEVIAGLLVQHEELIDYLIGKDIRSAMDDLYQPGEIVDSTVADTFTGATLRGNKIVSAIRDALSRGVYSY